MILETKLGPGRKDFLDIGKFFSIVYKDTNLEEFKKCATASLGELFKDFFETTHAILIYNDGQEMEPLYHDYRYVVLNGKGKRIKNLTFKK